MYKNAKNRAEVEANVNEYLEILAEQPWYPKLRIRNVCSDLSIFDWWNDNLSVSQLKQMKSFLATAGKLGYNGYVCFKVGAKGCSHGMWAHKEESTTGYSPDGECLFHSFRSGDNYWDVKLPSGKWLHETVTDEYQFSLSEIKKALEA